MLKILSAAALIGAALVAALPTADVAGDPLDAMEGTWSVRVRSWSGPGGTPTERTTTVERRRVQGLLQTLAADPAQRDALPFHALFHNSRAGRFESVFSSPASPGLVLLTGQADGSGKTIILTGSAESGDGGRVRWKEVHTVVDETTTRTEFFQTPPGGQEWLAIEMTYSRASRRDDPLRKPDPLGPRPVTPPTHPNPRPPR